MRLKAKKVVQEGQAFRSKTLNFIYVEKKFENTFYFISKNAWIVSNSDFFLISFLKKNLHSFAADYLIRKKIKSNFLHFFSCEIFFQYRKKGNI